MCSHWRSILWTGLCLAALPALAQSTSHHGGGGGGGGSQCRPVVVIRYPAYYWDRWDWDSRFWVSDPWTDVNTRVAVRVKPKDTMVVVDGKDMGQAGDFDGTPGYLVLTPGRHHIELKRSGMKTWHQHVEVTSGQSLRLDHKMVAGEGDENSPEPPASLVQRPAVKVDVARVAAPATRLVVSLEPKASTVFLDGKPLSEEQLAGTEVSAGDHVLDLFHPDFGPARLVVSATAGEATTVTLSYGAESG